MGYVQSLQSALDPGVGAVAGDIAHGDGSGGVAEDRESLADLVDDELEDQGGLACSRGPADYVDFAGWEDFVNDVFKRDGMGSGIGRHLFLSATRSAGGVTVAVVTLPGNQEVRFWGLSAREDSTGVGRAQENCALVCGSSTGR